MASQPKSLRGTKENACGGGCINQAGPTPLLLHTQPLLAPAEGTGQVIKPKVIDVAEAEELIERRKIKPKLEGLDLVAYRNRVQRVLLNLMDHSLALQKIKVGYPVSEDELQEITSLVLAQEPDLDLNDLKEYYPETAGRLELAARHKLLFAVHLNANILCTSRHANHQRKMKKFIQMQT